MANFAIREPNVLDLPINIQHVKAKFFDRVSTLHIHPQIELAIATKGSCSYYVAGENYPLKQGDCIFVNSNLEHGTHFFPPESAIDIIYFRLNDFESQEFAKEFPAIWAYLKLSDARCHVFEQHRIYEYIMDIVREFNDKSPFYNMFVKANIFSILGVLYREGVLNSPYSSPKNTKIYKLEPLLDYINEHYNENISLDFASNILNFNKSYFSRMFKDTTGHNFTEYLNQIRINRSLELLTGSDNTIIEISEQLGFSSPTYFTEVFKKYYRCTPTEFKKKITH